MLGTKQKTERAANMMICEDLIHIVSQVGYYSLHAVNGQTGFRKVAE